MGYYFVKQIFFYIYFRIIIILRYRGEYKECKSLKREIERECICILVKRTTGTKSGSLPRDCLGYKIGMLHKIYITTRGSVDIPGCLSRNSYQARAGATPMHRKTPSGPVQKHPPPISPCLLHILFVLHLCCRLLDPKDTCVIHPATKTVNS